MFKFYGKGDPGEWITLAELPPNLILEVIHVDAVCQGPVLFGYSDISNSKEIIGPVNLVLHTLEEGRFRIPGGKQLVARGSKQFHIRVMAFVTEYWNSK
jgi:hypothetical protein